MATLFERACKTEMHSRFIARADDLERDLTDNETIEEAEYLLEMLPDSGYEDKYIKKAMKELKTLLKTE